MQSNLRAKHDQGNNINLVAKEASPDKGSRNDTSQDNPEFNTSETHQSETQVLGSQVIFTKRHILDTQKASKTLTWFLTMGSVVLLTSTYSLFVLI